MVFSSVEFILFFLPIFLIVYYITPVSYRNVVLLFGSLIFYAYGEPKYIVLLLVSMVLNYWLARGMASEKSGIFLRKGCFYIGILTNLSLLLVFKIAPQELGLPLGISFYTFQSISYLIDVYRKDIPVETSLLKLSTYICMFPQLVAGPIVTYQEVKKQLDHPVTTWEGFDAGLKDFSAGLIMKVLLADRLSLLFKEIAGMGYISAPTSVLWLGSVGYSLQIYFDFFGYSMMAIGLGRMLGFNLPVNFNLPYMSTSVREFYRRWHITLGRWFAKYVYIPLGGSRNGMKKTLRNLFIVWILTSLWHGVSINFILWGMILCLVIMIEKVVSYYWNQKKDGAKSETVDLKNNTTENTETEQKTKKLNLNLIIKKTLQHIYVLFIIVLTWTCFAVTDFQDLSTYLGRMFGILSGVRVNETIFMTLLGKYGFTILIGILLCTNKAHQCYKEWKDGYLGMITLAILFWVSVWYIHMMGDNPFLYFRF
ncbi:MAG: MBOAT family protein [Lachnospiraceae bacterium]|nr:MBOAT family protein [Lachnospiraceae bacterium]MDD5852682.1 MBOAT family protein [Lachnospiraceae bacterium]